MTAVVNQGSYPLGPADEGPHPPGDGQLWNESYYLDFVAADGSIGGWVRLGLYPNWDRAWYWACVARPGRPSVTVVDNDLPVPPDGRSAVGAGFRASYEVTAAFDSARATLEAEGLGLDLEWHTEGGVYGYSLTPRYEIPCTVNGTVRVGGRSVAVNGFGERDHSWGDRDWWTLSWLWTSGRLDDGTHLHGMRANVGVELPWPGFTVPPGGTLTHADAVVGSRFEDDGTPASSTLRLAGIEVAVTPLVVDAVAMTSPVGAAARFPRALCRFDAADGRSGWGWTEWHQPPGWRDHAWTAS